MKHILISLLLLVLVTSCAHNKIRFVKQPKQEIVKVDVYESSSEDNAEVPVAKKTTRSSKQSRKETVDKELEDEVLNSSDWNTPEPTDTIADPIVIKNTKETKKTKEEIAEIATEEARKAKENMALAIWSGITILFLIGFVLSPLLFLKARKHLIAAKRSRYITQKGELYLKRAKRRQTIWIVLVSIVIVLGILLLLFING